MSKEMIDRATMAVLRMTYPAQIKDAKDHNGGTLHLPPGVWEKCRATAIAVIDAIREPNEEMIASGYSHPGMAEPGDPEYVWHLMINAAFPIDDLFWQDGAENL